MIGYDIIKWRYGGLGGILMWHYNDWIWHYNILRKRLLPQYCVNSRANRYFHQTNQRPSNIFACGVGGWVDCAITPSPFWLEGRPSIIMIMKHLRRPQVNFRLPKMFNLGHYWARQCGFIGRSMNLFKSMTPSTNVIFLANPVLYCKT